MTATSRFSTVATGAAFGCAAGAGVGALWALGVSLGGLSVPDPLFVDGPLLTFLLGVCAGGALGVLLGASVGLALPAGDMEGTASAGRRGGLGQRASAHLAQAGEARRARLLCALVGAVYAASFCLPAIDFGPGGNPHASARPGGVVWGVTAFLLGWVWPFAWVANPLLWAGTAFLAFGWWRTAATLGCLGLLGGLTAALFVLEPEAHFLPGYYLWMGSLALPACGGLAFRARTASGGRGTEESPKAPRGGRTAVAEAPAATKEEAHS